MYVCMKFVCTFCHDFSSFSPVAFLSEAKPIERVICATVFPGQFDLEQLNLTPFGPNNVLVFVLQMTHSPFEINTKIILLILCKCFLFKYIVICNLQKKLLQETHRSGTGS